MNLVGNSCIASFITKNDLKEEFSNPFVWCLIDFNSMYYLIKNWYKINFLNYEIKLTDNYITIIIDKNIIVKYVHYKLSNDETPIIKDVDVYCKNILKYAEEKYLSRTKRMLDKNTKPTFIIANGFNHNLNSVGYYTLKQCKAIQDLKSDFMIYICYDYLKNNILNKGKLKLIQNKIKMNTRGANYNLAKFIYSKF